LWFFVLLNLAGARVAGWAQVLTTIVKLLPMAGVIGLGIWVLLNDPVAYRQHVPVSPASLLDVSNATTQTLYAMLGIECATIPACRVLNPERTIPLATVIGTLLTAVVYVSVSIVPLFLMPQSALAASNAPIADLFVRSLGSRSGEVVAMFVSIGGLGALNGWTMILGEVTQNIARHGHFPKSWAKENQHGAPTVALILTGVIASIMLLSNYSHSISGLFLFLSNVVVASNLPMYFACTLAILLLRWRGAESLSAKPTVGVVVAAACAVLYCTWASVGIGVKALKWTVVLCACCIPLYWLSRRRDVLRAQSE
jgi:APA family basic amino acid/polyamine antiporter